MDWASAAVFGLGATTELTVVMIAAQMASRTRLDLPLMLGTIATENSDLARVAGFAIHEEIARAACEPRQLPQALTRASRVQAARSRTTTTMHACRELTWLC